MRTLQKRIIRITICLMIAAAVIVTCLSVLFLRSDERLDTDQLLLPLCETGEKNLDYSTMAKQVESIRLYNDGYAFLCDAQGNLFYHPRIDVIGETKENEVIIPEGLSGERSFVHYTHDGMEKRAVWLPLENGMRLYVSVPISDTHSSWRRLTLQLSLSAAIVVLLLGVFAFFYIGHVIKTAEGAGTYSG